MHNSTLDSLLLLLMTMVEAQSLLRGLAASTTTPSAAKVVVVVLDDPDAHSQLSVAAVLDRVFGGMAGYVSVFWSRIRVLLLHQVPSALLCD
jgi:hypothetical protein